VSRNKVTAKERIEHKEGELFEILYPFFPFALFVISRKKLKEDSPQKNT
jgi:hypothetical protein